MASDNIETIQLDSVSPTFAEPEYTVPKESSATPRLGSIKLDSIDPEAPFGRKLDGSPAKRRGRPPGQTYGTKPKLATVRDAREVEKRVAKLLTGATGVASVWREHIQMTDQEASDIADPLSAYLIRQEEFSTHVKDFLDHYDLAAAGIAFLAYLVRVYKDDIEYRQQRQSPDVVEARTIRRTSRKRDETTDATPRPLEVVKESEAETSWQYSGSDGELSEFPTTLPPWQ